MEITHRVAVHILFFNEKNEVLLMERTGTGKFDGEFCAPAGQVEFGEPVIKAAVREIKEEVGVDVNMADLVFEGTMDRPRGIGTPGLRVINFYFSCRKWVGEIRNMEPNKHADPQWYALDKLPEGLFMSIGTVLGKLGEPRLMVEGV